LKLPFLSAHMGPPVSSCGFRTLVLLPAHVLGDGVHGLGELSGAVNAGAAYFVFVCNGFQSITLRR